jgi:hypothetical protein
VAAGCFEVGRRECGNNNFIRSVGFTYNVSIIKLSDTLENLAKLVTIMEIDVDILVLINVNGNTAIPGVCSVPVGSPSISELGTGVER